MQNFHHISLFRGRVGESKIRKAKSRALRSIAILLCSLMLTGGPTHAGPVTISEVIQVVGSYQNPPELRLRSLTQTASTPISGVRGSVVTSHVKHGAEGVAGSAPPGTDSLLVGVTNDPQRGVEIIDQGEVEGTICDCGEIDILGGGFPKWPLLFLAAIPLFFIDTGGDVDTPTNSSTPEITPTPLVTPTPTPPETPIPEPASLLLFGTGLAAFGAGLRRRYFKAKLAAQVDGSKEA